MRDYCAHDYNVERGLVRRIRININASKKENRALANKIFSEKRVTSYPVPPTQNPTELYFQSDESLKTDFLKVVDSFGGGTVTATDALGKNRSSNSSVA